MQMMRTMVLGSVLVGAALLVSCGGVEQTPTPTPTPTPAPPPETTLIYARAAVEVGTIDISQMAEFEVSVQRMDPAQRSELWLRLSQLHADNHPSLHPSQATNGTTSSALSVEASGCSPSRCSHSVGCSADWCCAFGEDAVYYGSGGCPVE